eukprot:6481698-Amphidinium_carterae.2
MVLSGLVPGAVRSKGYSGQKFLETHLLRCVILTDMLKSDSALPEVLGKASAMTFLPRLGILGQRSIPLQSQQKCLSTH